MGVEHMGRERHLIKSRKRRIGTNRWFLERNDLPQTHKLSFSFEPGTNRTQSFWSPRLVVIRREKRGPIKVDESPTQNPQSQAKKSKHPIFYSVIRVFLSIRARIFWYRYTLCFRKKCPPRIKWRDSGEES